MKRNKKERKGEAVAKKYIDTAQYVALYTFLGACIVGALFFISSSFSTNEIRKAGVKHEATMTLPDGNVSVEIASTKEEVEQGLSGRERIDQNEGMLFVFPSMGQYAFWMKDMKFVLDMVWISDEGRVVYIKENAIPDSYPKKTFKNEAYAKYVLEMKAGSVAKYGLFLGTSVGLPSGLGK